MNFYFKVRQVSAKFSNKNNRNEVFHENRILERSGAQRNYV